MFSKSLKTIGIEEKGWITAEYGLIIALIATLLIGVLIAINGGVSNIFGNIADSMKNSGK